MSVFIVIPGYNESKHIGKVVSKLKRLKYKNIIFVDDGSKDKSADVAEKAGAIVLRHVINIGKGAAAKTGCDYAINKGAKIIVLMDADGQHDPSDVSRLLNEMKKTKSSIVFGYRKFSTEMPFVMKFGNQFINWATSVFNGLTLKDTQSGFRCFSSRAYSTIKWESSDYSIESEMISNVGKNHLKYSEVPIRTIYNDNFKGTSIFDGIKIFINIVKFKIFGGIV